MVTVKSLSFKLDQLTEHGIVGDPVTGHNFLQQVADTFVLILGVRYGFVWLRHCWHKQTYDPTHQFRQTHPLQCGDGYIAEMFRALFLIEVDFV
jgi:hypothetical protein